MKNSQKKNIQIKKKKGNFTYVVHNSYVLPYVNTKKFNIYKYNPFLMYEKVHVSISLLIINDDATYVNKFRQILDKKIYRNCVLCKQKKRNDLGLEEKDF